MVRWLKGCASGVNLVNGVRKNEHERDRLYALGRSVDVYVTAATIPSPANTRDLCILAEEVTDVYSGFGTCNAGLPNSYIISEIVFYRLLELRSAI